MCEETYNYGSFKQSKMFAAGVTCSDCHDPHSAKLRLAGDDTCLQCHSPAKYADVRHHRHEAVNPPLSCASCHMPTRTYMVVDQRHDHSFRIPRPDISVKLGTPNACNDCHKDKPAEWSAAAIEGWHGPNRKGFQNYAAAFHSAWNDQPDAAKLLAVVAADRNAPAIARASALVELGSRMTPEILGLARTSLADPDPMVRIGALDALQDLPLDQRWSIASPLLSDPIRGVRIRTVSLLGDVPSSRLSEADRGRFDRAAEEFVAAQKFNADRPEARSTLGAFYARRGRTGEAGGGIQGGASIEPAIYRRLHQSCGSIPADGPGRRWRKGLAQRHKSSSPAMAGCITRSVSAWCGSSGSTRRLSSCAVPPNWTATTRDTPISTA